MGYISRSPHKVPFPSVRNRKLRYQLAHTHLMEQQTAGKMLPGLMTLNFYFDIWMVGSEFGVTITEEKLNKFFLS